jgi:NAD(P)-dependent dehydrogenase (short-subunit alcohol dehydrogenase family)
MKGAVVVIDAAERAGRGVVQAALIASRSIIAVSNDTDELALLRGDSSRVDLVTVRGSIANEAESVRLAGALRELGRPFEGIVIASCGSPLGGRVLDHSVAAFRQRLEADLVPQLAAARSLLPLLTSGGRTGSYIVIGSPGAEHPWAGYSYCSVAAAAKNMLVRVLHEEARAFDVRVQLLAVKKPIRAAENGDRAGEDWPDAVAIGEQALALVDRAELRTANEAVVPFTPRPLSRTSQPADQVTTSLAQIARSTLLAAEDLERDELSVLDQTRRAIKPILDSTQKTRGK